MSVRRHVLLPALVLAFAVGFVEWSAFIVLFRTFELDPRADRLAYEAFVVVTRLLSLAVGVGLVAAHGYWVGTRSDLREDWAALLVVLAAGAVAGFGLAFLSTPVIGVRLFDGGLVATLALGAVTVAEATARFALVGLAGAAVAQFRTAVPGADAEPS